MAKTPIYRHQASKPDRCYYDTQRANNSGWTEGVEAFAAYDTQEPGTVPIYRHEAPDPDRYCYDTQRTNNSGWSEGVVAFYAYATEAPGTVPIYWHRATDRPDRYYYDTQISGGEGWSTGTVAFYAFPGPHPIVPIYRHEAPDPERYYYDDQRANNSGWSAGVQAFYAYETQDPGTIPIYRHQAPKPDRYCYDEQRANNSGWSEGVVAFYAYKSPEPWTVPIYWHRATERPDRYYYDTRQAAAPGWGEGSVAFHAMPFAAPNNWMSYFQDARIHDILIPGTHDSGTEGFPAGSPSRTQYYNINEQLEGGVRFLDMRLAYNSVEDNFHVVHGTDVASNLNFDTVVKWCADFLKRNPSETILMSIKQEGLRPGPDSAFAKELGEWNTKHVAKGDWKEDLWYNKENEMPTVAEARGKIVLLRRYVPVSNPPVGSSLFDYGLSLVPINNMQQGTFLIVGTYSVGVQCMFQDEYKLESPTKEIYIENLLKSMVSPGNATQGLWFINFASTSSPGPLRAANKINPWLDGKLKAMTQRHYGVLITDYAQPELWRRIYEINFLPR